MKNKILHDLTYEGDGWMNENVDEWISDRKIIQGNIKTGKKS